MPAVWVICPPLQLRNVVVAVIRGSLMKPSHAATAPTPTTISARDATNWSYLTVCVCLAQWMVHNLLLEPPAATMAITPNVAVVAPPSVPQSAPPALQSAPWIPTWGGVPPAVVGDVAARRVSSAQHTLPQHAGSTRSASSPRRGPRHSFPTSAGPSSGVFSGLVKLLIAVYPLVEPGEYEIAGHPTHRLALRNQDTEDYLNRFSLHGLLITIDVPRQGLIAPAAFTDQVMSALAVNHLTMPPSPQPLSPTDAVHLHKQPYCLLAPHRRQTLFKLQTHPSITANSFGIEEFRKLSKKLPNPLPADGTPPPLIFICPRYGNISGPLTHASFANQPRPSTGLDLPHPCFGVRVLENLHYSGTGFLPDPECYLVCLDGASPDENRPTTPPPPMNLSASLIRPRSSPNRLLWIVVYVSARALMLSTDSDREPCISSNAAATAIVLQDQSENRLADIETTQLQPVVAPMPPAPQFHTLKRSDVQPLRFGPHWHARLTYTCGKLVSVIKRERLASQPSTCMQRPLRPLQKAYLVCFCIINSVPPRLNPLYCPLVLYLARPQRQSCLFPEFANHARFHASRIRRLHNSSEGEVAIGPGPERAAYRQAISNAVQDHRFWGPAASGGFFIPVFSMAGITTPERCQIFAAYGSLLAIHSFTLGQGPIPVSIWLLLALVSGKSGMLIPSDVLVALDPDAFDTLAPWLTMEVTDSVPSDFRHPLCQFLMNSVDVQARAFLTLFSDHLAESSPQPYQIPNQRTQEDHDALTIAFTTRVLLVVPHSGTIRSTLHLSGGFDVAGGEYRLTQYRPAIAMLACLYDRKLRSISDVINHLSCSISCSLQDGTTPYFAALFRLLLQRYLSGAGHPANLRGGLIEQSVWEKDDGNPLLRVGLLLQAATDADLWPTSQTWSIKFHVSTRDLPTNVGDTVISYFRLLMIKLR
ncbi:hypothetical protein B0H14DRAFT_2655107 [Mycena olivaceomarginata]|nr:hypothetical protein B0H14DRAFT_2655107 [Mycena olivaceomarginata]